MNLIESNNLKSHIYDTTSLTISNDTRPFLALGGFTALYGQEKAESDLKAQIAAVNQSVIDTNASVQKVNNKYWIPLVVALIAALGTVGSFILEYQKERLDHKQESVDSLRQ